ncbi:glycosyltransferase family 2 protein [Streptococcus cameli]
MDKLVSIVVTCYNHEQYIEQCLRSVFAQTYQQIELIILNDGSTDQSETIIQSLLKESPFAKTSYHFHENQGVVRTRNKGFDLVEGDFLLFVDSDNYLPDNFVSALVNKAEQEQADLIYTKLVDCESKEILISMPEFDLATMYKGNFMDNCSLIRRSIIGDVRYDYQLKKLVDYDFFMNLIVNKKAKAVSCMETCIYYRVLDQSISDHKNTSKFYEAYSHLLSKYTLQNPDFAREALDFNFKRAIYLSDPKMKYQNEKLTIYYSEDQNFSEEKTLKYAFNYKETLSLSFDASVRFIRVDMTELPIFFKSLCLVQVANQTELEPIHTNGFRKGDGCFFPTEDPQMVYSLGNKESHQLELMYELANVTEIQEDDYLGSIVTSQLQTLDQQLKATLQAQRQLKNQNEYQEKELHQLQAAFSQLNQEYHAIIGSRRWIIPTKIINFFRRK